MKSKLYRKLIEKMNTCTVFLLVLTSSLFLINLKAESNFLDLSYNWIHDPLKNFFESNEVVDVDLIDKTQEEHVVIFDAGSTGTRIHVFTFLIQTSKKNLLAGNRKQKITLKNEYFKSISPGLSSYAEQPEQAAKSIQSLLQFANTVVDEDLRQDTYLSLIATAGLRLLPNDQSSAILRNIENLFKNLDKPFKLSDDSIRILDGNSEGIFSWVTINFLLKKIHNAKKSVAVLDLGGGSTQITFSPNLEETFRQSPEHFLIKRKILGEDEYLYTHSYLGFGLMATRKEILLESINRNKQYFVHENINLTHPCFPNDQVFTWSYQYVTYTITGVEGDCYQFINHYFKRTNKVKKAPELNLRNIYGISYYYDLMVNLGKVDPLKHIGQVSVYDYYLAAKKICGSYFDTEKKTSNRRFRGQKRLEKESIYEIKNPNEFQCLDLTYTANLLNTGFGLQWRKKLTLGKKINNVELSWALGAAFSKLKFA